MRLTSFTDFGLRALMLLGSAPGRAETSAMLARELGVSRHHLIKVLQRLADAGYVRAARGAGGGVRLAEPPETIRIGEVVALLEGNQPLVECCRGDGGRCPLTPECRLRGMLMQARATFLETLNAQTLADCVWPGRGHWGRAIVDRSGRVQSAESSGTKGAKRMQKTADKTNREPKKPDSSPVPAKQKITPEIEEEEPRSYSSPPCMMGELDEILDIQQPRPDQC